MIRKEGGKKVNGELMMCGGRGMNGVERMFVGSIWEDIRGDGKWDVVVVRREKK
ncbi:adenine nucleotide alpha hydrolase family protein [Siminovitchia fortis]|uniref:universal stress protein n=1 Tax=Siminovitchia fortis TaxID=254758 RepID=UPI00119FE498|nr:universal stress protein [Siminovitchia fortis]